MDTKFRIRTSAAVSAISQGGQTANLADEYNYPPRVEIVPTQNNTYAPMEVGIEVKLVGFHTDPQNVWVWGDYGDPGGFAIELPKNIQMLGKLVNPEWINMNRLRGRFCGHIYDTPGTRTVTAHARDIDGQVYSATLDLTATDPWDHFENHLWIDPDGDFVDETGVDRQAEGHECLTEMPFQWEPRHGGRTDTWIHIRRGKRIPQEPGPGGNSPYDWANNPNPHVGGMRNNFFSSFGEEADGKPILDYGIYAGRYAKGRVVQHGLICDNPGKYDALTEHGTTNANPYRFGSGDFAQASVLVYNCENYGGRYGIEINGYGYRDSDQALSPNYHPDQWAFAAGCVGFNFYDFGIWGSAGRQIVIGCLLGRDTESFQGMALDYGRAKSRRYPSDPADYTNVHAPARMSGMMPQGYMVLCLNDIFSQCGWTDAGYPGEDRTAPGYQPGLRLFSAGMEIMPRVHMNSNLIESAAAAMVINGLGEPSDGQFTIENNIMLVSQLYGWGEVIAKPSTGAVVRNNLIIRAPNGRPSSIPVRMNYPSSDDLPKSWGKSPIRVYGNTDMCWGAEAVPYRTWHNHQKEKFIYYNPDMDPIAPEKTVQIEEHDNFKYYPNFEDPETEGFAGFLNLPCVARWAGIKWQDKFFDRQDQKTMDRRFEFAPFTEHNGEQQQTAAAPISNQPATGPNPLFWDFFYQERDPDSTVKGAFTPNTQYHTADGPVFTLQPYIKLTSNGAVRYNAGHMAGGSASLVELSLSGTVIASGADGDADSGEVAHGATNGERHELVMTVAVSDGSTETVRLPFVHPS